MVETGGVHFAIAGDAGQLLSAQRQAKQAQKDLERAMKESAREAKGFEKAAERISRQVETMPEKFARLKREAATVFKSGKLDAETYKKRLRQISQEIVTYNKKLDGAKSKLAETGKEGDKLGNKLSGAFNVEAIVAYGLGLANAGKLLQAYMKELTDFHEKSIEIVKSLKESEAALNQIATQRVRLPAMMEHAELIAQESGVPLAVAQDLVFKGQSEGIPLGTIGRLAQFQHTMDPMASANIAGKMPLLFNDPAAPRPDNLTGMEALNILMASAEKSPFNAEMMARHLPKVAEGAVQAGAGIEESAAILAVLAPKTAKEAGIADAMKSYGEFIASKPELAGRGMVGGTRALEGMTEEQRRDLIKENKEVWKAYRWMKGALMPAEEGKYNIQDIYRINREARARTGTDSSKVSMAEMRAKEELNFRARTALERAEIAEETVYTSDAGANQLLIRAIHKQYFSALRKSDEFLQIPQEQLGFMWNQYSPLAKYPQFGFETLGKNPEAMARYYARRLTDRGHIQTESGEWVESHTIPRGERMSLAERNAYIEKLAQSWIEGIGDLTTLMEKQNALLEKQLKEPEATTEGIDNLPPVVGAPK